jgi:hypothetical protein
MLECTGTKAAGRGSAQGTPERMGTRAAGGGSMDAGVHGHKGHRWRERTRALSRGGGSADTGVHGH